MTLTISYDGVGRDYAVKFTSNGGRPAAATGATATVTGPTTIDITGGDDSLDLGPITGISLAGCSFNQTNLVTASTPGPISYQWKKGTGSVTTAGTVTATVNSNVIEIEDWTATDTMTLDLDLTLDGQTITIVNAVTVTLT